MVKHYKDEFIPIRLQFFEDISTQLKGFLEGLQVDLQMVTILVEKLERMSRTLINMFVQRNVLDKVKTMYHLVTLDVSNKENLVFSELLKLPTATNTCLKKCLVLLVSMFSQESVTSHIVITVTLCNT